MLNACFKTDYKYNWNCDFWIMPTCTKHLTFDFWLPELTRPPYQLDLAVCFFLLKGPESQFLYSQLGRVVIKKHTYLTPITHATYPWNYAQPPGRKSAFKMPKTVYPKRWYYQASKQAFLECSWLNKPFQETLVAPARSSPSSHLAGRIGFMRTLQDWCRDLGSCSSKSG